MPSAYDQLVTRLKRIHALGEASGALQWDQETFMPSGGTEARAVQLSTLSTLSHELFTAPEVGKLLAAAEKEETDDVHRALLRETRHSYDRATKVPGALVERLSKATSRALPKWVEARKRSDFATFAPILSEIVDVRRDMAAKIDPSGDPYAVLFEDYEPWIPLEDARANLAALRDGLKPILDAAVESTRAAGPDTVFTGEWPIDGQEKLGKHVLDAVGYDWTRGRLDPSAHPFSTGNRYDARITTRYDVNDALGALLSTVHEFGHSLYTLGLPEAHFGTPLGDARDLSVHESQSRLWENHVARSEPFMEFLLPALRDAFPGRLDKVTAHDAWRAANRVEPSLIRVEADELTYHMHIAVRFEVEEGIVSGRTAIEDIPAAWNERMESYLGVTPPDDAHGCLQDIHWSHGAFGYFPTYSLGSMLAAQLYRAFEAANGPFTENIRRGDFAPLREWLRENVHTHGKRYRTGELVEKATGAPLTPDAFLAYARDKFQRVAAPS